MRRILFAIAVFVPLFAFDPDFSAAQVSLMDEFLGAEFWTEYEIPGTAPRTQAEIAQAIFEEAREVFAGIIYGFEFRYVPADKARSVREEFELKALGTISWGDTRLSSRETRAENGRLYVWLEYRPDGAQLASLRSWRNSSPAPAQGVGRAPYKAGAEARTEARRIAALEALRAHVRPLVHNKPRELRGRLAFENVPRMTVVENEYVAALRVRIDIVEVLPYLLF